MKDQHPTDDATTDTLGRRLADAKKRAEENRAELDRRVDESWHRAAAFFSSEQKELKRLEERLAQLERRTDALR